MKTKYKLQIFDTADSLSETACKFIIDLARKRIKERGRFNVVLSGGNTPKKLYEMLSWPPFNTQINWAKTYIFWGDERCVPLTDEQNNAYVAKMALLDKVPIPVGNIFPIPVNLQPAEAASSYEKTIKDFFEGGAASFDLILLGLGENGHTASLFPGTTILNEQERWIGEVFVEEQKMYRVTMTTPLINQARNIAFLVTGSEKAEILKTVLTGAYNPEVYPAQLIKPESGKLYWWVDEGAAALVKEFEKLG